MKESDFNKLMLMLNLPTISLVDNDYHLFIAKENTNSFVVPKSLILSNGKEVKNKSVQTFGRTSSIIHLLLLHYTEYISF